MNISINSVEYVLKGKLQWAKAPAFPQVLRSSNEEMRAQRQPIPEIGLGSPGLVGGMGRKYWKPENNMYHFGTCHTVWPGQITLPLRVFTATETGYAAAMQNLGYALLGNGTLLGFCKDGGSLKVGSFNGTTWTLLATIEASISTFYGATSVKNWGGISGGCAAFVVYTDASGYGRYGYSSNGTDWTLGNIGTLAGIAASAATGPLGVATGPQSVDTEPAIAISYKKSALHLAAVFYRPSTSTWVAVGSSGPQDYGTYAPISVFPIGGGYGLYLVDQSGLYRSITTPPGTYSHDFNTAINLAGLRGVLNGVSMCAFGPYLAIPVAGGGLLFYSPDGTVEEAGVDIADGFPSAYKGDITALFTDRYFLFAAVKGASYSGVYYFDAGYHPLWVGASSVSIPAIFAAATGGIPSVHFSPAAGTNYYIPNHHTNPLELPVATLQTYGFEESGWTDFPIYGGELQDIQGTFYSIGAYASALSANEKITVTIGYDGAAASTTAVGTITSTTRKLALGTSSLGHRAYTAQLRCTLYRATGSGNSHLTPVLYYPALMASRGGDISRILALQVDILATSRLRSISPATVVDELLTLANSGILVSISFGKVATTYSADVQKLVVGESDGDIVAEMQFQEADVS